MSDRGDIIDRANERAEQILDAELSEVRHRAQTMPAAADDNCIISRLRRSIGPLFRPILMPSKRFRK